MSAPNPPDPRRIAELFPPVIPDAADRQTFELGLVLGGTVSVGAYTAGALDFLLQALERWHENSPAHRIHIKTVGGSSGGAVCAAILGLMSSRQLPHVEQDRGEKDAAAASNPLWNLWVNQFQISKLLTTDDIDAEQNADAGSGAPRGRAVQHVASLLNTAMIDQAAEALARLGTTPGAPLPWFGAPLRVVVTVANMRGIPYRVQGLPPSSPTEGAVFVQHDDFAWFAFPNGANRDAPVPQGKREDEFWLVPDGADPANGVVDYGTLAKYATASGAMPVVLRARALSRPAEHYRYRPRVRPYDQTPGYKVEMPQPDWSALPGVTDPGALYSFTAVDGGTFNNDPVTLVHRAMAGLIGHNPPSPAKATRAILMIDPLANNLQSKDAKGEPPMVNVGTSVVSVLSNLIGTMTGAARYLTADLDLFTDKEVFSRFQLIPFREEEDGIKVGMEALAGAPLQAVGGWCHRAYRVHDYLLGRANMERYLRAEMLLAGDNPLFANWSDAACKEYAVDALGNRLPDASATNRAAFYLPIIPLPPDLGQKQPDWPKRKFRADDLSEPLQARLSAVFKTLVDDNVDSLALKWLVDLLGADKAADFVADKAVTALRRDMKKVGL